MAYVPFPYDKTARRNPRLAPSEQVVPISRETPEAAMGGDPAFPSAINYEGFNPQSAVEEPVTAPPSNPAIDPTVLPPSTGPSANWRMNRAPDVETLGPVAPAPAADTAAPEITDPGLARIRATHDAHRAAQGLGPEPVQSSGIATTEHTPTVHYEKGRPVNASGPDQGESRQALQQATNDYIPQKDNWKTRLGKAAIGVGSMLASSLGHDREGANRAGFALGQNLGDPALANRRWQQQRKADLAGEQELDLERRKTEAQVENLNAESAAKRRGPARQTQVVKDKNGVFRVIDKETGRDAAGKLIEGEVQGQKAGGFKGWAHDEQGVAHYYEDGKDTGRVDPGRNKIRLPDGSLIDSSQKYTADSAAGREKRATERGNDAAVQENARIQANIDAAKKEMANISAGLNATGGDGGSGKKLMTPRTIRKYVWNGKDNVEQEVPNPIYDDAMTRYRQLDDQIRRDTASLKPIVKPNAATSAPQKASLTIDGAVARFKVKHKRAPTKEETDNMQAAINAQK